MQILNATQISSWTPHNTAIITHSESKSDAMQPRRCDQRTPDWQQQHSCSLWADHISQWIKNSKYLDGENWFLSYAHKVQPSAAHMQSFVWHCARRIYVFHGWLSRIVRRDASEIEFATYLGQDRRPGWLRLSIRDLWCLLGGTTLLFVLHG